MMTFALVGCVPLVPISTAPAPTPVATPPPPAPTQVQPATQTLPQPEPTVPGITTAQVQQLSDEVRSLRDQVDVLESELEKTRKRQNDLYSDLDARLRKVESMPTATPVPQSQQTTAETAEPVLVEAEVADQNETETVELTELQPPVDPTVVRDLYDQAFRNLKVGKYEESITDFTSLIENYPDSELVDDALYWIGEAHYITKNYDSALEKFDQIIENYPQHRRAPEAMLKIGFIYYDREKYDQAQNYLVEVIDRFPSSRSAFSARRRIDQMIRDGNDQ